MGVFVDKPIESEAQANGVRWALALCESYLERPSALLPPAIVNSIVEETSQRVVRYKRELADWELKGKRRK